MGQRQASEFQGRKGLHRKVDYRPGMRIYYAGIVAFQLMLLALSLYFIFSVIINKTSFTNLIYPAAVLVMFLTSPARDIIRIFFGDYLSTAATIKADGIFLEGGRGNHEIKYADVERVTTGRAFNFFSDITLFLKGGKKVFFPRWLERSDYILDTLKSFKPELIDQKMFEAYRIKVIDFDHSMSRAVKRMDLKRLFFLYLGVPAGLFLISEVLRAAGVLPPIFESGTKLFLFSIQILFSAATAGIIMTFEEMFIRRRFQAQITQNPLAVRRELNYENKMMSVGNKAVVVTAICVWVILLLSNAETLIYPG